MREQKIFCKEKLKEDQMVATKAGLRRNPETPYPAFNRKCSGYVFIKTKTAMLKKD